MIPGGLPLRMPFTPIWLRTGSGHIRDRSAEIACLLQVPTSKTTGLLLAAVATGNGAMQASRVTGMSKETEQIHTDWQLTMEIAQAGSDVLGSKCFADQNAVDHLMQECLSRPLCCWIDAAGSLDHSLQDSEPDFIVIPTRVGPFVGSLPSSNRRYHLRTEVIPFKHALLGKRQRHTKCLALPRRAEA